MTIETQYEEGVDFSKYSTWNWLPELQEQSVDPRIADPVVQNRIRRAIESQLGEQGFNRTMDSPDFFVVYHAALEDGLSQTMVDDWYDNNAANAEYSTNMQVNYTNSWEEGSLLIDILDSKTVEIVWRGSARAEIKVEANDEEKDKRIKEAVQKMFEKFPPKS